MRKLAVFCVLLLASGWASAQALRFDIPDALPLEGFVDGKPAGVGVDLVEQVFKQAGINYELSSVPNYERFAAKANVGLSDAVFLVSQNPERDAKAVFSQPICTIRWIWLARKDQANFDPKSPQFKAKFATGSVLHNNIYWWLKHNDYWVRGAPKNEGVLIAMLNAGRLDAILATEITIASQLKRMGKSLNDYQVVQQQEIPMGIYFWKSRLDANAGLLEKINEAIQESNRRHGKLSVCEVSWAHAFGREYQPIYGEPRN